VTQATICVEDVSKQYHIGTDGGKCSTRTFREAVADALTEPVRRLGRSAGTASAEDTIWALKNVSFTVQPGEVVGVVGRNGSGKSTLLKILSRITGPTSGTIRLNGRVGSLLEVGTGFHPELTGRENVFLNGSILGMRRREIEREFDAIVDFAEVGKFLDTPVKRYSSGMYVRLAFAVAAHLNPEILLVDEVLAVGDVDFQQKCIGSMQTVAKSGRTVLIVSHNLALIESLCHSAVWLDRGALAGTGTAEAVISSYMSKTRSWASSNLLDYPRRDPNPKARFAAIRILDREGNECRDLTMGKGISVKLDILADEPIRKPWVGVTLLTPHNQRVFHCANREAGYQLPPIDGHCSVTCHLDALNLLPGRYYIDLSLADMANTMHDVIPSAAYIDIHKTDILETGMPMGQEYGMVYFTSRWEMGEERRESALLREVATAGAGA
jgi:homopolymeric O-antigen transport system ATP-binding protein